MNPVADRLRLLSVVIPNYNYERYVADAVRSALDLDWPDVEVIVVDDGSTDRSVEVLRSFGQQIRLICQANGGQRSAYRRGFTESRGDAVVFLDSDDQLDTSIVREAAGVWRTGISKVQVQMQRVDSVGREKGGVFPRFHRTPRPEQIEYWMTTTSAYPTPPGSGNVYARAALERYFAVEHTFPEVPVTGIRGGDADAALLAAAPYLGDVVTVAKPLVSYRVHDSNISKRADIGRRFTHEVERAFERHLFAVRLAADTDPRPTDVVRALRRGRHLLQLRVAQRRLSGGPSPLPGDDRGSLLRDIVTDVFAPGPETIRERMLVAAWCLATLLAPAVFARRLVAQRFG